ncbi:MULTISPECIES: cytochrome c biogenesis protein CcdA [unclassified Asaia]|uniref:cytochrome c biogenesis CcdA family protein n=1 Tax=unclassified Asaia TaxID=2685023 RepID=UPI0030173B16
MSYALNPALAYAAGALTILSPCVLPLVPIVLSSAAQRHRLAPVALTAGLVLAFSFTGFVVAVFGQTIGIDVLSVRAAGAIVLCFSGLVLLVPKLQSAAERLMTPAAAWAGRQQALFDEHAGLWGQALIGMLLGVVWAPCAGPTLGAAIALAAGGRDLGEAAVVMAAFGLGISSVLLAIAFAARNAFTHWRGRAMVAGKRGKILLGSVLLFVGITILTGADRHIEAIMLDYLPKSVTKWSTII